MATPPPSKYLCLESSSERDDSMVLSAGALIFPSDDSSDDQTEYPRDSTIIIYPSEESSYAVTDTIDSEVSNSVPDHSKLLELTKDVDVCSNSDEVAVCKEDEELEKIGKLLVGSCCKKLCLRYLTAMDITASKVDFLPLKDTERKQYLFSKLKQNSCEVDSHKIMTKYFIAGKEVCELAWCKVYSISQRKLNRMLKDISFGECRVVHGNQGKKRVNTKSESVAVWMERYFQLIGDKMPTNNQIHLPSWETQKDIYQRYCQDMSLREEEEAGMSTFYKIWAEQFPHVVIPQVCNYNYISTFTN